MKKITIVYGTRPEFIKLFPLIKYLRQDKSIILQVISSGQHTDLLDRAHFEESFTPDINLNIKRKYGDLNELQMLIFKKLHELSKLDTKPDLLMVHGDTATAFSAALFAFQFQIPIAHIESGLRSKNLMSPFPEEFYRQSISKMATLNFAPTEVEKENLLSEGLDKNRLFVVGNTILDAVQSRKISHSKRRNRVLITVHRRENREYLNSLLKRINNLSILLEEIKFEYLLHPSVSNIVDKKMYPFVNFIEPMSHCDFLNYIQNSRFIISDSGGVQEEASLLGVKTLLFRDHTERLDGLGENVELIGTNLNKLSFRISELAKENIEEVVYQFIPNSISKNITIIIKKYLNSSSEELCLS